MRTIIRNNYTPKAGDYHERIIIDNSRHKTWLFDCDGIWTDITKIYLAEEFGDSSDIGLTQKFITEQFKATDGKIDELENTLNEEVAGLNERIDGVEEDLALETENRAAADEDLRGYIDEVAEDLEELKNSPDVVDIVNTKADLDAYDTSKLGANDIVRVLADETQDGASTYYKWTGSTWNYIGKTGPYYTKVETDNLLDEKADKSDLDNYYSKTETDGLLNDKADKATTYTKTEVDNLIPDITPLATKQEVTDGLATKQNTLTAGENITIENDVISATGGTKSVELTQAEYDALTPEQKMDGTVYYITDGQGGGGKTYTGQDGVIVDNTNDVIKADANYLDSLYAPLTAIEFVGDAGDPSGVYLTVGDGAGRFSLTEETTGVLFDNETGGRVTRLASISYVDDHTSNEINDTDWSALWQ